MWGSTHHSLQNRLLRLWCAGCRYSYFIKTGGDPRVTSGFREFADKCCRQSPKDCRWFINVDNATAFAACMQALAGGGSCLPCSGGGGRGANSSALGCPDWRTPPPPRPENASRSWQIHLAGGGWCYNASDCWGRTHSYLGSSRLFNRSKVPSGGLLSPLSSENPRFFAWNRVQIRWDFPMWSPPPIL